MGTANGMTVAKPTSGWDDCEASVTERLLKTRRNEIQAFAIALRDDAFLNFISTSEGSESFSDVVELAVKEYGVSQREVASSTDVSTATVSRWMNGQSLPPRYVRKNIVEAIGMIIDHNLDL